MINETVDELVYESDFSTHDLLLAATKKLADDCTKYEDPVKSEEKEMIFNLFKLASYSEDPDRQAEFAEELQEKYSVVDD